MLTLRDCGSVRNYAVYLVAKALDTALYVVTLAVLAVPGLICLVAEWLLAILTPCLGAAHRVRRAVSGRLVTVMQRWMAPVDAPADGADEPRKPTP